jgi:virginiamycin B lyase
MRRSWSLSAWKMRWLPVSLLVATLVVAGVATANADGPPLCQGMCATAIVPPAGSSPFGITSGPRGSVWFSLSSAVGRIDQRRQITTYPIPAVNPVPPFTNAGVGWMTTDPSSGAVWFAERGTGKVGRIMPNGAITEFSLPKRTAVPMGIVFGPDGNLYISEGGSNAIARLNPTNGEVVDFPVPTPNSTTQSGALGPDGAIWFIERSAAKVGRMALNGTFTEYPLASGAFPNRIVTGPDGALWFTELMHNKLGRITTGGALTEYAISGGPVGIVVGKDGQLYLDLLLAPGVDRVNLQGQVTGHWGLPGGVGPILIATGFGLDIWVSDTLGGKIYRVTPYDLGR